METGIEWLIRTGNERIEQAKADQLMLVAESVRARQPVLIFGVKYVPASE